MSNTSEPCQKFDNGLITIPIRNVAGALGPVRAHRFLVKATLVPKLGTHRRTMSSQKRPADDTAAPAKRIRSDVAERKALRKEQTCSVVKMKLNSFLTDKGRLLNFEHWVLQANKAVFEA